MPDAMQDALETLSARIDVPGTPSDWFEVTQARINDFADVTLDHQWIHIDEERAKAGPFGTTIAHGHLTLSMMGHLPRAVAESTPRLEGQKLSINYGFDRVRFPRAGSRWRPDSDHEHAEARRGQGRHDRDHERGRGRGRRAREAMLRGREPWPVGVLT